jgi:predicted ATPase
MRERGDIRRDETGYWVAGSNLHLDLLPPKVEGVIETRIERLDPDLRKVLSVASVEGESFTVEVVARVLEIDERKLISRISQELDKKHHLVKGQGVGRLGSRRVSQYRYRHNLIQLYLYNSLDEVELDYLHEAIGNELERLYGQQSEEVAIELARHFEQAGLAAKAVEYLYQAGSRAVRIPANEEAIDHFKRGLLLLESMPESAERDSQELALQIALFAPLAAAKGYGVPEVGQAYTRARALCEKIDDPDQLFLVLYGLWGHNLVRSELQTSRELAADCLALAEQERKVAFLMEAHRMTDESAFYMGEFGRAREHFERSIALYDPQEHGAHAEIYGQDPGVALLSHGCCILWQVGLPEQALQRSQEAIALAQKQNHPFSLGFALCYSAMMHQYRREPDAVLELTEATIKLSHEQGFVIWLGQAACLQGWALAEQGQTAEGISLISQGMADMRATGTEFLTAYTTALLAAAMAKIGQVKDAQSLLEDAFKSVDIKGQGLYEAELYRLKGELLLQQGAAFEEVEGHFQQAIEVARRRQTLAQELRAVTSLSRLWQGKEKSAEAHAALFESYGRFEEGFDTADLREARELLEELAGGLS